jgi:hypothetical protein
LRYELFFATSAPLASPQAAFERYFEKRPPYKNGRGVARYENADTGVGFTFDCTSEPLATPGSARPWARFTIELLRPSFFPEEATREIEPFVRHFESRVFEVPGAEPAEYSPAGFRRAWHDASRRAYEEALQTARQAGVTLSRMPRRALHAAWQWNYHRQGLQTHEGDALFVPRIWFLRSGEEMSTSIIWPEAMAARVPQVEYVLFSRGAFEHDASSGRSDVALVSWDTVAPAFSGSTCYDSLSVSWRVTDPEMLASLAKVVSSTPPTRKLPDLVPLDTVLDEEGFPEEGIVDGDRPPA